MPLKGYYMKKLYPAPLMRSCCDLDVWFDPSREKEVKAALGELGFTMKNAGENHMFHTYGAASLEMHYSLGKIPACPDYYADVFSRLVHVGGSLYNFTDEDFYVFLIAHLYKHFKSGGTGIRSVLDIYVYNEKKPDLDRDYLAGEFAALGLVSFEEKLRALAYRWFGGEEISDEPDPLADYVLGSGVYGTVQNATVNGAAKHGKGRVFSAAGLSRRKHDEKDVPRFAAVHAFFAVLLLLAAAESGVHQTESGKKLPYVFQRRG